MKNRMMSEQGITVPADYNPRWYQIEVHQAMDNGYKRFMLFWHRRLGKDFTCVNITFMEMVKRVGVYFYMLPSYAQGRKILWEGIDEEGKRFIDRMPPELIKTRRDNEMYMELKNGSIFRVIGANKDKIDDLIGAGPVGIVMSEFGVGEDYQVVLDKFMPVLQKNGGWLIINGTVRGRNHYYDLYNNALNMPEEWFVSSLQTISPDYHTGRYTGVFSPEQIQLLRSQGMDEDEILQEYGMSFSAGVKGSIFDKCIARCRSQGRIREFTIDDHVWVDAFFDLGNKDMTSIWFLQRSGDKLIWIDYYQNNQQDWPFYVNVLQNKGYRYRNLYLPHDGDNAYVMMPQLSPRKVLSSCLKESGIGGNVKTVKRPKNKNDLIDMCKRRFSYYYFDSGRCYEGIRLVEKFHKRYDPIRKVFTKEAVHDESSHCVDALMLESLVKHNVREEYIQKADNMYRDKIKYKHTSILERFNRE